MGDHTTKRIETLKLLKELQQPNEKPGATFLRALYALRRLPDVERVRDEWCNEYAALRDAQHGREERVGE
jgi:hypothetical protein